MLPQDDRFLAGAVVVGAERHRVLIDLGEQLVAEPRQAALGVAHRRGAVTVERAEVARSVDERVAQREGLRHAHQRLVERRVAVRVEASHHVADHGGALAVLAVGGEVLLPHRVQDPALHRLEAVADVGQGARRDHRQRVVQVPRLRGLVERRTCLRAHLPRECLELRQLTCQRRPFLGRQSVHALAESLEVLGRLLWRARRVLAARGAGQLPRQRRDRRRTLLRAPVDARSLMRILQLTPDAERGSRVADPRSVRDRSTRGVVARRGLPAQGRHD